jgi:amino acid adenylation domain-containing protein
VLEAFEHRQYPFNRLVDELGAERDSSRNPVFDVMVSLQNAGKLKLALPGITASGLFEEPATSKLDLTFDFEDSADGLILGIRYNSDLFGAGSIDAMGRHFLSLLDSVLADADQTVAKLALMPPAEYRQVVYDFNQTAATYPHDATLVALFDRQAAATPGHIAIVDGHERLTYADLGARSRRIASVVAAAGPGRGSVMGLLADRSAWLPAAMLGVLRAGAAYVPMDVAHPPARLAATIRAAGCRMVLTHGAPALPAIAGVTFMPVDRAGADLAETGAGPCAGDPAYVIFTSGTTGAPKGVVVTHGNAVAFLSAMAAEPGCGPGDTLLSVTTPSFDIFGLEIFLPLTTGGRVVLAGRDDATDGGRLSELIARERVTMMQATPAIWRLLCDAGWAGDGRLKMLCGGEALPPALAGSLISRGGPLWNLYGPTETTIWSTVARLADAGPPVPIGKPIGNTRVYVLDPGMRPVPIGIRGEIVIAGAGVARGYLGAPALTAQRFVPDPFRQGGRMYRTGDLGQWLPDGQLEYLGRADGQLKIRGHRIEAAEVEHALRGLGGVRDAAVAARPGPDGQAELCAYLVAAAPSLETSDLDTPGLRWALREALPSAMVPTRFVVLDRLPLMPNGKVDRRALPAPSPARSTSLPASEAERLLAAQWAEVLGVPAVGPDDDFFDLGGHSLMAMTLAGRISRSMGVNCTLADVFASPTVAALTARLRQRAPARFIPIKRIPDAPRYAASHAQRRLWVVSQSRRGSVAYNMMQTVLIEDAPGAEPLDTQALEAAFRGLIAAHEALRTTFQAEDDDLWQIVHPPETAAEFRIVPIDLSAEPMPEETARRLIAAEAATPFDLAAGPLLRAALMCAGPGRHVLTINMHHIVADAWSLRMMARELARNYRAARSGHDNPVPAPAIQCRDIAAWQAELDRQGILAAQRAYWLTKLAGVMPARLPADRPRPAEPGFGGATVIVTIQPDTVAALQRFGRSRRAGLFSVLLTAVDILIYRYTGCEDIVVGCVVAGRTVPELENQIGFHVNTLPLRSRVSGAASPGTLLPEIARTAADAFAHQEYPFDRLLADLPARGADQLFDVVVDYHEDDGEDASEAFGGLRLAPFAGRPPVAKFDLLFLFIRDRHGLRVTLEYATDLFNEARIAGMAGHFRQILGALLTDPERPVIELPLSGNAAAPAVRTHDDALAHFDFAEEQS